ncbi:interleukin-32 isoform X4 [Pongo abelii]|uniref:interleukin-32 isoform X4 n=1 Tax=Pongo abelii TaxID=9601 RepID=UPI0023E85127|nr:interleukin-32 isoform X4 [Pongo abelii]
MCFAKVHSAAIKDLRAGMVMPLPTSAQGLGAWVSACDTEDTMGHLGPWRDKDQALWCQHCLSSQHQAVDRYCDKMENAESGPGQDNFKESYLDTMEAHYQEHHPKLIPLLEKERDGLRCRGNRSPVPDVEDPATKEPGEISWEKVMRQFQAMLQRLQTWLHRVLAWVKEAAALVLEVQALWKEFESFWCCLSKLFMSSFES